MAMGTAGESGNVETFVASTAPCVPRRTAAQQPEHSTSEASTSEPSGYFVLSDLWHAHSFALLLSTLRRLPSLTPVRVVAPLSRQCYREWSAFGAEVPISIGSNETVMQYYVPFLSALQLFEWQQGADSPELLFEFFEDRQPYGRAPLSEKVTELIESDDTFAELQRWPSSSLHPSSWLSVAWYPIYRIPMGASLKETSACFLAYYRIRMPFSDIPDQENAYLSPSSVDKLVSRAYHWGGGAGACRSMAPFALATYKLKADFAGQSEIENYVGPMTRAARRWVNARQVQHHDLNFFMR